MARFLTVTPNPAIDVTYAVARQAIGETLRVEEHTRVPGGKGLNVAAVLAALGRDAITVQPLGGGAGEWIARQLDRRGVACLAVPIEGETRTTVAIVDGLAHPTLLAEAGPSLTAPEWDALVAAVGTAARDGGWVVVAGSFPPGVQAHHVEELVSRARGAGARVLVDTSGPALRAAARAGADVVKANRDEVLDATGETDLDRASEVLGAAGATVVVSLGAHGLSLRAPDGRRIEQAAVPGVEGNPTGAGDAATAGLVAALADGQDASVALAWAAVCGAAAVLRPIAGAVEPADLLALAARLPSPPGGSLVPSTRKGAP